MDEQESLLAAINEDVHLQPYDPLWPSGSCRYACQTCYRCDGRGQIHAGRSRAGMTICNSGYTTSAEFNATLHDRQWFMRCKNGHRTHHLHVVVHGENVWRERICFRDRLLADRELAVRYAALKARLAESLGADREAYTDGKSAFVKSAVSGG